MTCDLVRQFRIRGKTPEKIKIAEQRTTKTMRSPWRSVFGYLVTRWAGHNACHGPVARTADELLNF